MVVAADCALNRRLGRRGAPLRDDVDDPAQRVSSEDRTGAGQDLDSFNILDGNQIEVHDIGVRLVHPDAVDEHRDAGGRLGVETSQVHGRLEAIAVRVVGDQPRHLPEGFLNRPRLDPLDVLTGDNVHLTRYASRFLNHVRQAGRGENHLLPDQLLFLVCCGHEFRTLKGHPV